MTAPRIVKEGDVVFVSARCVQRFFLLRPDRRLTAGIRFLLAHYARKYDIELYAACVMSSHIHLVYQDHGARGPHFLRDLHRAIAVLVHEIHGWQGGVFAQRPSQVRLLTPEAIVDKIAYTLANPVEAGGVAKGSEWPGLWIGTGSRGQAEVPRPSAFPRHGRFPETAPLKINVPSALVSAYGECAARRRLLLALRGAERRNRRRVEASGNAFRRPGACARVPITTRSSSRELDREHEPQFSILGGTAEMRREVRASYRAFRARYAEALVRFRAGDRKCCFPSGTFNMRWVYKVQCGESDPIPGDGVSLLGQDATDGIRVERKRGGNLRRSIQ